MVARLILTVCLLLPIQSVRIETCYSCGGIGYGWFSWQGTYRCPFCNGQGRVMVRRHAPAECLLYMEQF